MCRMCDGLSLDDVLADDAAQIAEHGYVLIGVDDPDPDRSPWIYTVGLLDTAGHPELIIAGVSIDTSASLLSALAGSVLEGERYEAGETIRLPRGVARVGAVNEVQYELDTFNMWHNQWVEGNVQAAELEALQILLPSTLFCSVHGDVQPRLDHRDARVGVRPRPNRAQRRGRYHGRHRN